MKRGPTISSLALSALGIAFAAAAAYMLYAASLGVEITTYQPILLHVQAMDVLIGVGAAICATICISTVALMERP